MRKLDTILTGGLVTVAAHVLFVLGFAVGLEFAIKAARDWFTGLAWVQGQAVRMEEALNRPKDPIHAILADGSLDPEYTGPIDKLPEFPSAWWVFLSRLQMDEQERHRYLARQLQGSYQPPGSVEGWSWHIDDGIRHFDRDAECDGVLTDEGFIADQNAKSSFHDAVLAFPQLYRVIPSNGRYSVLLYATRSGLHRADLHARTIERLASLPAGPAAFHGGGQRNFDAPVPRIFVVTPSSVHWCDTAPGGAFGSFDLPAPMQGLPAYDVAPGADERVIVRAYLEQYGTPGTARLRTTVFAANGAVLDSYEYEIDSADLISAYGLAGELAGQNLGVTVTGKLVQATMPPAWRLPLDPAEAFFPPERYAFRRGWLKTIGGLWMALALSGVAAALIGRQARRRGAGWAATIAWASAVVALGIPMALAAIFTIRPARRETCAGCGARQASRRAACRRCGAAVPGPAKLGIEIT